MILLNFTVTGFRWLPEVLWLSGWFTDIRWLNFQFTVYSYKAANLVSNRINSEASKITTEYLTGNLD